MEYFSFEAAFARVKEFTEIKKLTQLAEFIGISQPAVSKAKKRGDFPTDWAVALEGKYGLLTRWILTGEGPMKHNQGETPQTAAQPPPIAEAADLPDFLIELNAWAREISKSGNLDWLEEQLATCLPTWQIWREKKKGEEAPLLQSQMTEKKVA